MQCRCAPDEAPRGSARPADATVRLPLFPTHAHARVGHLYRADVQCVGDVLLVSGSWPLPVSFRLVVRDGESEANAVMAAAVLIAGAREPQVFERLAKPLAATRFLSAVERVGAPALEQVGRRFRIGFVAGFAAFRHPRRITSCSAKYCSVASVDDGRAGEAMFLPSEASVDHPAQDLRPLRAQFVSRPLSGVGGLCSNGTMLKRRRTASSTLRRAGLWLPTNTSLKAGT